MANDRYYQDHGVCQHCDLIGYDPEHCTCPNKKKDTKRSIKVIKPIRVMLVNTIDPDHDESHGFCVIESLWDEMAGNYWGPAEDAPAKFETEEEAQKWIRAHEDQLIINGWIIQYNNYDGFPATRPLIAFHPIYDGHYWEQFDTMAEVRAFCTKERFDEWEANLK